MFDKSRRARVLGAVAICGGLSLAATSFAQELRGELRKTRTCR